MLCATLKNLLNCDPLPNEVIVAEQTEGSVKEIKDILGKFGKKGCLVRPKIANAQAARNDAARIAKSEILLFLDDDVIPDPFLVGAHLQNYKNTSIHAVAGFYLEPGEIASEQVKSTCWWRPLTKIERISALYTKKSRFPALAKLQWIDPQGCVF